MPARTLEVPPPTATEADLLKSGMSMARPSAARVGYLPIPLEQCIIEALSAIPVYLHTGAGAANDRFTLYSSESARFTEIHRRRLNAAGVKFIYIPISHHTKFQTQVEDNLVQMAADPNVALNAKSALVYETSLELINEILGEQGVAKSLPRLEKIARSVSTLVMKEGKAFSHLFATAQHDFYTATHMVNVGTWMTSLACAMGIEDTTVLNAACTAGMVHDVGKMYVPEEVLNKVGPLTNDDWARLREHPGKGHEHLKSQGVTDEIILRVCLEHHERMDGTGYPLKMKGKDMHLMSRICAVVDSFDAMTACRPFKNKVKTIAEAVQILQKETPEKYDPVVVEAWVNMLTKAAHDGLINEPIIAAPATDKVGRRAHERFNVDCPARVCTLRQTKDGWTEGECILGKSHNISRGGLGLLLTRSINPGTYIRVYLKGAGSLDNRVMEGKAVRCRAYKDGNHEIGIKFCHPGADETAAAKVASEASPTPTPATSPEGTRSVSAGPSPAPK